MALAFLTQSHTLRAAAIIGAMVTDGLDGYIARRNRRSTQIGAVLDPLMDKFFVTVALLVFLTEGQINPWQMAALVCRDFAVVLFGIYLHLTGEWGKYRFRAIWCGKLTTALQFLVLMALTFHYTVATQIYSCFLVLGVFALVELYLMARPASEPAS